MALDIQPPQGLDIIGDVHGQLGALRSLGRALGYDVDRGWTHPDSRRLVFLGDLIDRGPHSLEVAQLALELCQRREALCLLGNHELNLVEWRHGRTTPKHSNEATIADVDARRSQWEPVLDFFEQLPLALEWNDLRVVHAVWNAGCVAELEGLATPALESPFAPIWSPLVRLHGPYAGGALRPEVPRHKFVDARCGQQWEKSLEVFLKGHEIKAKPFRDNDGTTRDNTRVMWWTNEAWEAPKDKRTIFGHYWNMPPVAGVHEKLVPPHPSGHPLLRSWSAEMLRHIVTEGRHAVPQDLMTVCIDFNGVVNVDGRPCLGAYRYPEAEVVWASSPAPHE